MREEVYQLCLRSSATASESDARHAHFISTLREAHRVLQPLQEAQAAVAESACRPSAQSSHSFAALEVEEPSAEPAEADSVAAASTVGFSSPSGAGETITISFTPAIFAGKTCI